MISELKVGQRIRFSEERQAYRVRASGGRYAVCTKPFNLRHTVLYTVVDFQRRVRGTENLVFGMGAETDEQCVGMLARLESGESEVSSRNWIPLSIVDGPWLGFGTIGQPRGLQGPSGARREVD